MKLLISTIFVLFAFGVQAFAQTDQRLFDLIGHKYNFGRPKPMYCLFDENGRSIVLAEDGEIRWFDDPTKPPVRTARIKEVPVFDYPPDYYSPEEKKAIEDLTKYHQTVFGDIPVVSFGSPPIPRPGGKEFCLTDADSKFYFYSTGTGELLRKVLIQKPKHKYAPLFTALSDDNKIILTSSHILGKAYVHSMETGKLLFEIDSSMFSDYSALSPDGLTLYHTHNNILSRYSTKTGKKSAADITIDSESTGEIKVSQTGDKIAITLYTKGNYDGQALMNVETGKITKCDPTLKHFSVLAFTPDGKLLAVANDRGYMHFIDTATGRHSFSYISTFNDLWVKAVGVVFSPDSTKMSFTTGADRDMQYYIYLDLTQRRIRPVGKLEPLAW